MRSNSLQIVSRHTPPDAAPPTSEPAKQLDLPAYLETMCRALRVSEVAPLLKISERQVYKLAADQLIPSMKIAGCIRFDGVVLASWLRKNSGGAQ